MSCGGVQGDQLLTSAMICKKSLMHTRDPVNCSALSVGFAWVIELEYDINSVNDLPKPPQTAEKARYFPVKVDRKGLIGRNKRPTAYPNSIDRLEVAGFVLATLISKGAWSMMWRKISCIPKQNLPSHIIWM
jgi:hypothetical protein